MLNERKKYHFFAVGSLSQYHTHVHTEVSLYFFVSVHLLIQRICFQTYCGGVLAEIATTMVRRAETMSFQSVDPAKKTK